jgi:hypothetical protein
VAWREGNRGNRFTGPRALKDSRGAREDQIMHIKRGPGKAESRAPEGPWKVVYGCDPAVYQSHPGKGNRAQIAIKCRIDKKRGLVRPPRLIGDPKVSRLPEVLGPQGFWGPRGSFSPKCSRAPRGCRVPTRYGAKWASKASRGPQIDSGQ